MIAFSTWGKEDNSSLVHSSSEVESHPFLEDNAYHQNRYLIPVVIRFPHRVGIEEPTKFKFSLCPCLMSTEILLSILKVQRQGGLL